MASRKSAERVGLADLTGTTVHRLDGRLVSLGPVVGFSVSASVSEEGVNAASPEARSAAEAVRDRLHALLTVTRAQEARTFASVRDWAWRAPAMRCSHCGQRIPDHERKTVLGSVEDVVVDLHLVRAALAAMPETHALRVTPAERRLVISCAPFSIVIAARIPRPEEKIHPLPMVPAPLLRRQDKPARKGTDYGFNAWPRKWPSKARNRVSPGQEGNRESERSEGDEETDPRQ